MRRLSDTIERLVRLTGVAPSGVSENRLRRLQTDFQNPGGLSAWYRLPENPPFPVALVVVLHGCTQTAASYDVGSGWSKLADDFGFAVLFPEQARQNNANLCFNWFLDEDTRRDSGEVLSIRGMIDSMASNRGIDPQRIFITGLSAGGAMANAMLAAYPEVFAGGAIIAGLPFGIASTIPEAFDRMRGHGLPAPPVLQDRLRAASSHAGPWPTISVWHGTADRTVDEGNARAIVEQWKSVHNVAKNPSRSEVAEEQEHLIWTDSSGQDAIELHRIARMGHGTPLDVSGGYGKPGPFMLDVGISSTEHIARSWGLTPSFARRAMSEDMDAGEAPNQGRSSPVGIQDVIENALRTAGLMK